MSKFDLFEFPAVYLRENVIYHEKMKNDQWSCAFILPWKTVRTRSLNFAGENSKGTLNRGERNTDFTLKALPDLIKYND